MDDTEKIQRFVDDVIAECQDKGDNNADILSVLERHGYEQFSDAEKLLAMKGEVFHVRWDQYLREQEPSLLTQMVQEDNVNCVKSLLPFIPLTINPYNISSDLTWTGSCEEENNRLLMNKARWSPEVCHCEYHNVFDPDDSVKLCIMTQLASSSLAAEMFVDGCKTKANKCLKYLLKKAPNLVKLKGVDGVFYPLVAALSYGANIWRTLLKRKAPYGHLVDLVLDVVYKSQNKRSVKFVTETYLRGREDELISYRDARGNTILHKLLSLAPYLKLAEKDKTFAFKIVKQLLELNVDIFARNNNNDSALDQMLLRYMACVNAICYWNPIRYVDFQTQQIFIGCIQILLPMYKGGPPGDVHLQDIPDPAEDLPSGLLLNNNITANDNFAFHLFQNVKLIMDSDAFSNLDATLCELLTYLPMSCRSTISCSLCEPAVSLFYAAMDKGLNIKCSPPNMRTYDDMGYVHSLLRKLERPPHRVGNCLCISPAHPDKLLTSCNCCSWSLLELLVHCGADLSQVLDTSTDDEPRFLQLLARQQSAMDQLRLLKISMLVTIIWMYHPQSNSLVARFLSNLWQDSHDSNVTSTVSDLQVLVQSVRPLKLLSRLCILQHVQWKDVKQLPVPPLLQHYIRIGDISPNHVVHQITSGTSDL